MADNNKQNEIKIELTPEVASGNYANLAVIAHTPGEFFLDFIAVSPNMPQARVNTRVIMNPENAKNLLAVGASQDSPSQANHCSGGTGPTADGRRKPEIYAPGCSTRSSLNGSGCSTTTLSRQVTR